MSGLFEVVALILLAEILIRLSAKKRPERPVTFDPPAPEKSNKHVHMFIPPAPSIMSEYDEETRKEVDNWCAAKKRECSERLNAARS